MPGGGPPVCAPGVTRLLNTLFTSPVDRLSFPSPRPSYDDAVFPWSAADLIWLRDPHTEFQFPVAVVEPLVRRAARARRGPHAGAAYWLGRRERSARAH